MSSDAPIDGQTAFYAFVMGVFGLAVMLSLPRFVLPLEHSEREELARLKAKGTAIIEAIEDHRAGSGRDPESLEELSLIVPGTRFGAWRYEVDDKGERFKIKVGDDGESGPGLEFESQGNGWVIDL